MNLACVLTSHQCPKLTADVRIGHEATCSRCGERMVLTCHRVRAGDERRMVIQWQPRRYVPRGDEDVRNQ